MKKILEWLIISILVIFAIFLLQKTCNSPDPEIIRDTTYIYDTVEKEIIVDNTQFPDPEIIYLPGDTVYIEGEVQIINDTTRRYTRTLVDNDSLTLSTVDTVVGKIIGHTKVNYKFNFPVQQNITNNYYYDKTAIYLGGHTGTPSVIVPNVPFGPSGTFLKDKWLINAGYDFNNRMVTAGFEYQVWKKKQGAN